MEPLPEKNIDSIFEEYDVDDVRTPMNNASEASLPTQPMYKARAALFTNVTQSKPFTSHSDGDQVNKSNPFAIHNESNNATIFKSPTSCVRMKRGIFAIALICILHIVTEVCSTW